QRRWRTRTRLCPHGPQVAGERLRHRVPDPAEVGIDAFTGVAVHRSDTLPAEDGAADRAGHDGSRTAPQPAEFRHTAAEHEYVRAGRPARIGGPLLRRTPDPSHAAVAAAP